MKLIFVRHGIAKGKHHEDYETDFQRPLTKEGKKEFRKLMKFIKKRFPVVDCVYSSARLRAVETAQIFLEKIESADFQLLPELDLEADPQLMIELIQKLPNANHVFVGHDPHLSQLVNKLLHVDVIALEKGAVCVLDYQDDKAVKLELLVV
jgi:phosphohistidine phosphatase